MCKMKKVTTFTQFEQKITYISECKLVYKYIIATVIVHICTVTVACVFIILLISIHTFFSLSSPCTTNSVTFLSSSSFSSNAHNHTHRKTHQHRQINTHTHSHTNKPTQTNQQRDRSVLDFLWFMRHSRLVDRRVV